MITANALVRYAWWHPIELRRRSSTARVNVISAVRLASREAAKMSDLAPPGSSTYNSDTMHVGDGTWDAGRDTFLLPNLVGLNFATMRYNGKRSVLEFEKKKKTEKWTRLTQDIGMGNRFFALNGYHGLVRAHGILATITFLLIVPAAILIMRFYGKNARRAVRLHIWLQTMTLLLVTAVFAIGWFQVGPRRSLTNPHHGVGLAIYVLIWVQVLGGVFVHRSERGRRRVHIPLKAMVHHWLGRAIALLGIAQVALGLTLYGSPLYLFVLYALWVFLLLLVYFVLQWRHERRRAQVMPGGQSQYSEEIITDTNPRKSHSGFGKVAAAGAAGAGLAALFSRRKAPKRRYSESDITGSYVSSSSSSSSGANEKPVPPQQQRRPSRGKRILEAGAIGGGLAAARSIFSRRRTIRDDESEIEPYRPPLGGNQSIISDSVSRLEEGRSNRPVTPVGMAAGGARPSTHPLAQPPMTQGSAISEDYSYYDYESSSPSRQGRHQTFKQALAAGGTFFAVRQLFKGRKEKKDVERGEHLRRQRIEQEKLARASTQHRYTGDGTAPPRRPRNSRVASQTASDVSSIIEGSVQRPATSRISGLGSTVTPVAAGAASAAAVSAPAERESIRPVGTDPTISIPGPPSALPVSTISSVAPTELPPAPPPHAVDPVSSGSELYTTVSGRQRHRHRLASDATAVAGGAALGAAAANRRRTDIQNTDSLESPPVSIHVKTQDNGRKVTLRRLTEEEAAAQRAARRQERRASRRRRNSSLSDSSAGDALGSLSADQRWRRVEQLEAEQQAAMDGRTPTQSAIGPSTYPTPPPTATQQAVDPVTGATYQVPAPPPIPASTSNLGPPGSITSPGTETSGPSEYANNRRRRRAERAQARLARGSQNTVDFT